MNIWEWIGSWTFFNWLALIAFILALVGFLNSFLSLKSRFKDWRATKSKEAFDKRISEFKRQIYRIEKYKNSPANLFSSILEDAIEPGITLLFSYFCLLMSLNGFFPPQVTFLDSIFARLLLLAALFTLIKPFNFLLKLKSSMNYYHNPELLVMEIIDLLRDGKSKGFTTEEIKIDLIIDKDMFTEGEKELIKKYLDKAQIRSLTQ